MNSMLRASLVLLAAFTFLLGLVYPASVWLIGQTFFSEEANGSLITYKGKFIGSELLGVEFLDPRYFWSRPSATSGHPYNVYASGASNLNPSNQLLVDVVAKRLAKLHESGIDEKTPIPSDLVLSSGSGLDPHISPASALIQAARVAEARKIDRQKLAKLVREHIQPRTFRFIGEPRVNVLRLNLALDQFAESMH